jgi:hypothetical protein
LRLYHVSIDSHNGVMSVNPATLNAFTGGQSSWINNDSVSRQPIVVNPEGRRAPAHHAGATGWHRWLNDSGSRRGQFCRQNGLCLPGRKIRTSEEETDQGEWLRRFRNLQVKRQSRKFCTIVPGKLGVRSVSNLTRQRQYPHDVSAAPWRQVPIGDGQFKLTPMTQPRPRATVFIQRRN